MKHFFKLGVFYIIFWILFFIGYVINVVKLIQCDFEAPYKVEIIRGASLITGLGGIVGYIPLQDKKQTTDEIHQSDLFLEKKEQKKRN